MKKREVILSPEALDDLKRLHDWMAMRAGTQTALAYIGRIETHCHGFVFGGERAPGGTTYVLDCAQPVLNGA